MIAPQRNSLIEEMYISVQNVEDTLNDTQNNELNEAHLVEARGGGVRENKGKFVCDIFRYN